MKYLPLEIKAVYTLYKFYHFRRCSVTELGFEGKCIGKLNVLIYNLIVFVHVVGLNVTTMEIVLVYCSRNNGKKESLKYVSEIELEHSTNNVNHIMLVLYVESINHD